MYATGLLLRQPTDRNDVVIQIYGPSSMDHGLPRQLPQIHLHGILQTIIQRIADEGMADAYLV